MYHLLNDLDATITISTIIIHGNFYYKVIIGTQNHEIELDLDPRDFEKNFIAYIKSRLEELERYESKL